MYLKAASIIVGAIFAAVIIAVRLKASKKPTSAKKILLPPMFMATGFFMFVIPVFRVPWLEAAEAFAVGLCFSVLLIITSKFSVKHGDIYLKRSRSFIFILIGLVVLRTVMKIYIGEGIQYTRLSGLSFILAFGMILPWRMAMYVMYRRFEKRLNNNDRFIPTS